MDEITKIAFELAFEKAASYSKDYWHEAAARQERLRDAKAISSLSAADRQALAFHSQQTNPKQGRADGRAAGGVSGGLMGAGAGLMAASHLNASGGKALASTLGGGALGALAGRSLGGSWGQASAEHNQRQHRAMKQHNAKDYKKQKALHAKLQLMGYDHTD